MRDDLIAPAAAPKKVPRRMYQLLPYLERQRLRHYAAIAFARGDSIRTAAAAMGYGYATPTGFSPTPA